MASEDRLIPSNAIRKMIDDAVEERGRWNGIQEGILQGERALFLRLLHKRYGDRVDMAIVQRIESATSEQITRWAERLMSIPSVAELLTD